MIGKKRRARRDELLAGFKARIMADPEVEEEPETQFGLDIERRPMKDQARIINEISLAHGRHPAEVTIPDIAAWEVAEEAF